MIQLMQDTAIQRRMLESLLVVSLICLLSISAVTSSMKLSPVARSPISLSSSSWKSEAINHIEEMDFLLYPPGVSLKARTHLVKQHPIYNFIHTYYRYSTQNVKKYSPGLDIVMKVTDIDDDSFYLNQKYLKMSAEGNLDFVSLDVVSLRIHTHSFFYQCELFHHFRFYVQNHCSNVIFQSFCYIIGLFLENSSVLVSFLQ